MPFYFWRNNQTNIQHATRINLSINVHVFVSKRVCVCERERGRERDDMWVRVQ